MSLGHFGGFLVPGVHVADDSADRVGVKNSFPPHSGFLRSIGEFGWGETSETPEFNSLDYSPF